MAANDYKSNAPPIGFYAIQDGWNGTSTISPSFDGIFPVGFYALNRFWNGDQAVVAQNGGVGSMLPFVNVRRSMRRNRRGR